METVRQITNPKTREIVFLIDVIKKTITNLIPKDSNQYPDVTKILIEGFTQIPSGFRKSGDKSGFGFAGQGYRILKDLSETLGNHK